MMCVNLLSAMRESMHKFVDYSGFIEVVLILAVMVVFGLWRVWGMPYLCSYPTDKIWWVVVLRLWSPFWPILPTVSDGRQALRSLSNELFKVWKVASLT